MIFKIQVL